MGKSFYHRYRPIQLIDLVGQERVIESLVKQGEKNLFSHAYLLAGQFGSGKTTIARILATMLTCQHRKGAMVCGKCDSCVAIHEGQCVDVIEIDAATNGKVAEARLLKESTNYAPQVLNKKIYIIDECHMLTTEAWNALLKIIEEPPAYVAFIFCTTNVGKVPNTILSRCQRYMFGRITIPSIMHRLSQVAQREKLELEEPASLEIARMSQGSMRDALSMLESVSVVSDGRITTKVVRSHFGMPEKTLTYQLVSMIADRDSAALMNIINDLVLSGIELRSIALEISDILRNALVLDVCGKDSKLLEISAEEKEVLQNLANKIGRTGLIQIAKSIGRVDQELAININARWILEAALLGCILYVSSEATKTK